MDKKCFVKITNMSLPWLILTMRINFAAFGARLEWPLMTGWKDCHPRECWVESIADNFILFNIFALTWTHKVMLISQCFSFWSVLWSTACVTVTKVFVHSEFIFTLYCTFCNPRLWNSNTQFSIELFFHIFVTWYTKDLVFVWLMYVHHLADWIAILELKSDIAHGTYCDIQSMNTAFVNVMHTSLKRTLVMLAMPCGSNPWWVEWKPGVNFI